MNNALRFDYNNMFLPGAFDGQAVSAISAEIEKAAGTLAANRANLEWAGLPYMPESEISAIEHAAALVRERFEAFVVLGIGGSALGPLAVHTALRHLKYNEVPKEKRGGPRFYVEDNIDPERMAALCDVIDVKNTCFNVITKSGSTSETMAQFLIVADLLKKHLGSAWTDNMIATTDKENGTLVKIAKEYGIRRLTIPAGVGGRFSELCAVGLLPAAVTGLDIRALLSGAASMDARLREKDVWRNPAYLGGALQYIAMKKGMNITVMMPYAESLRYIADWYAQLWAESLGKRLDRNGGEVFAGQTPVKALGVTDQHSQVQLYTEGPFDKTFTLIGVDKFRKETPIARGFEEHPGVAFLGGHTLNELITAEREATEYALAKAGRPNRTVMLPEISEHTIGQLLFFFEIETAFCGELLNINAFDQPGVEEGKKATYALLGRPGYDGKREELDARPQKRNELIL